MKNRIADIPAKTLAIAFITAFSLAGNCLMAQEAKFKALFIYKFVDYIQWPNQSAATTIGVSEGDEVYSELSRFTEGKAAINVRKIDVGSDLRDVRMLYLSDIESPLAKKLLLQIRDQPILVISNTTLSLEKGADIGFYLQDEKLRFAIRKRSIERKKMIPSSKLLELGKEL